MPAAIRQSWFGAMTNRFESFFMLISRYPMRFNPSEVRLLGAQQHRPRVVPCRGETGF